METRVVIAFISCAVAALAIFVYWAIGWDRREHAEWETFLKRHNCVKIGEVQPAPVVGVGLSPSGQPVTVISVVPGRAGWKCDDGVTYWR